MDRRIAYIIIALLAALLFFVAIGYSGWACGESILGPRCIKSKVNETTGALLLTAGLLIFIAGIFLIVLVVTETSWSEIVSAVIATVAAILAIAGVFYYQSEPAGVDRDYQLSLIKKCSSLPPVASTSVTVLRHFRTNEAHSWHQLAVDCQ